MATIYWLGTATTTAQVATCQVTAYDAATTYKLTVGGTTGVTVTTIAQGSVNATASALATAWNASTHPYMTAVTATSATDTVTLTADTAGVPFTATSSVSGGTGTIGSVTTTTSNTGPNDWSSVNNWSGGAIPANSDTVYIQDSSVNICWGLAQSGVTLTELIISKTYTGKIGLDRTVFATSADGATTNTARLEYRDTALAISSTTVRIGQHIGAGSPNGSGRIHLDTGSNASTITVYGTAASPSETGRSAVKLKANHASTDIFVRSAPGGVGVAVNVPGETTTVRKVSVSDTSTTTRVNLGAGTTITTWEQLGGTNVIQAAATITTVTMNGGILTSERDYTLTTVNMNGGTFYCNNTKSGGNAITTLNVNGGTIDAQGSTEARTWATVNMVVNGTLKADGAVLTVTTLNDPSGKYTLAAS